MRYINNTVLYYMIQNTEMLDMVYNELYYTLNRFQIKNLMVFFPLQIGTLNKHLIQQRHLKYIVIMHFWSWFLVTFLITVIWKWQITAN